MKTITSIDVKTIFVSCLGTKSQLSLCRYVFLRTTKKIVIEQCFDHWIAHFEDPFFNLIAISRDLSIISKNSRHFRGGNRKWCHDSRFFSMCEKVRCHWRSWGHMTILTNDNAEEVLSSPKITLPEPSWSKFRHIRFYSRPFLSSTFLEACSFHQAQHLRQPSGQNIQVTLTKFEEHINIKVSFATGVH